MSNIKDDAVKKAAAKSADKTNNATQKHSVSPPFHIGNTLFHNKRLRQKRAKFLTLRKASRRRQKTERRKKRLSALKADVTIDLLSDDEPTATVVTPVIKKLVQKKPQKPVFQSEPPLLIPLQTSKELIQQNTQSNPTALPQVILFPANIQISQVPNITLIPVQPLNANATTAVTKSKKNKRKTHPQKRPQPSLITESIVLTDDDSNMDFNHIQPPAASTPVPTVSVSPIMPATKQPIITSVTSSAPPPLVPLLSAQVDEEVSVSLVPRSKATGTCGPSHNKNALFPMLPDETTVHTVIANRIYELSLTKLREGLASCGIPEFADERKTGTASIRRKKNFVPPIVTPPPVPISLKLSSDLSISLISDDDDDDGAKTTSHKQHFNRSKLSTSAQRHQQQNIQLTVQHLPPQQVVPLPLISASRDVTHQKPRKRKLG